MPSELGPYLAAGAALAGVVVFSGVILVGLVVWRVPRLGPPK